MGPDIELDDLTSRVLDVVEQVPAGSVVTYGDVAQHCGTGPRQIGRIMATVGQLVPWWRVVRADGTSAVAHNAREHWDEEGIGYRESGDSWKVDLKAHRMEFR